MFVRDVDHIDSAFFCQNNGIIGTTWHVDVGLEGQLDSNGFVFDFGLVKKKFKEVLKQTVDHALILPKLSPQVSSKDGMNDIEIEAVTLTGETWSYRCPSQAIYFVSASSVTADSVARAIEQEMKHHLPRTVKSLQVSLREEMTGQNEGVFRYTHGLPGHEGACQRLFHGHRSKIEIYENNVRSERLEKIIAEDLLRSQMHIISPDQLISGNLVQFKTGNRGEFIEMNYSGSQGRFKAKIPAHRCMLFQHSTSIESISQNILSYLLNHSDISPNGSLIVRCFEGINKGGEASYQAL